MQFQVQVILGFNMSRVIVSYGCIYDGISSSWAWGDHCIDDRDRCFRFVATVAII